jgi:hypothetical protein
MRFRPSSFTVSRAFALAALLAAPLAGQGGVVIPGGDSLAAPPVLTPPASFPFEFSGVLFLNF